MKQTRSSLQTDREIIESDPLAQPLPLYRQRRNAGPKRVAVIGGGPIGLEAALRAHRLGFGVRLFEQADEVGADVRAWGHVTMFSPWADLRSEEGTVVARNALTESNTREPVDSLHPTGQEYVHLYLEGLARGLRDSISLGTRVVALGKSYLFPDQFAGDPERRKARRFRLLTRSNLEERVFTADYVIDATGVSHTPNWIGAGGMPAMGELGASDRILYRMPDLFGRDRIRFLGKRTLLVGDGASAATNALAIADVVSKEPAGSLIWVSKSDRTLPLQYIENDPLPRRDALYRRANLLIADPRPRIEYLAGTQVDAVHYRISSGTFLATLQVGHETRRVEVDTVVAAVGARAGVETFDPYLAPTEPGFFVVGAKRRASNVEFLIPSGMAQIREVFDKIQQDADAPSSTDAGYDPEIGAVIAP